MYDTPTPDTPGTTTSTRKTRSVLAATALALALTGLSACGSSSATDTSAPTAQVEADRNATTTVPTTPADAVHDDARVVRLHADTTVFDAPAAEAGVVTELTATTELGSPTALLVLDEADGWLHVSLPVRPNGSTGWIPRGELEVRTVEYRVVVDLAARRLTVTDGDQVVIESPVAVGTEDTPTPTGSFYVTDLVDTDDPEGAYGPYALGLSGHSDVLDQFGGGDGQLGLHGTNAPDSIGQAASHGCVRLPNEVVVALATALPLGTPVTIV